MDYIHNSLSIPSELKTIDEDHIMLVTKTAVTKFQNMLKVRKLKLVYK